MPLATELLMNHHISNWTADVISGLNNCRCLLEKVPAISRVYTYKFVHMYIQVLLCHHHVTPFPSRFLWNVYQLFFYHEQVMY